MWGRKYCRLEINFMVGEAFLCDSEHLLKGRQRYRLELSISWLFLSDQATIANVLLGGIAVIDLCLVYCLFVVSNSILEIR